MKIDCTCGALIVDETDHLPNKAHVIPDQEWFAALDALDNVLIEQLAGHRITKAEASLLVRQILVQHSRLVYECFSCGRLYIDDQQNKLHAYLPVQSAVAPHILRSA